MSPFILLSNGLTVVIVTKYVKKVTPTHVAVTYLAITDFMVGITPWFYLTSNLTQSYWKHWRNWCTFAVWFDYVSSALSTVAVMFVAVERCFLITKWVLYQKHYTVRKQNIISGVSASFVSEGVTADIAFTSVNPVLGKCYFDLITTRNVFGFILELIFSIIPFILILSYVRIIYFLWKQRRLVAARQQIQNQPTRERKTTILMALIVSIYLSTTVPAWIYPITLSEYVTIHQVGTLDIFICIFYCNTLVNPTLYASRIPVFKETYGKIFSRIPWFGRNRIDRMNASLEPRRNVDIIRNNKSLEPRRDLDNVFVTSHM